MPSMGVVTTGITMASAEASQYNPQLNVGQQRNPTMLTYAFTQLPASAAPVCLNFTGTKVAAASAILSNIIGLSVNISSCVVSTPTSSSSSASQAGATSSSQTSTTKAKGGQVGGAEPRASAWQATFLVIVFFIVITGSVKGNDNNVVAEKNINHKTEKIKYSKCDISVQVRHGRHNVGSSH